MVLIWKLRSDWLAFVMLEGAIHATEEEKKT